MLVDRGGKMNPNVYTALGKTRSVGCVGCLGTTSNAPYGNNWIVWLLAAGAAFYAYKKLR